MITHKQRKDIETCIEGLDAAIKVLDQSFLLMARISLDFSDEDKRQTKIALGVLIDGIEASIKDARYILAPIPDSSKEYFR